MTNRNEISNKIFKTILVMSVSAGIAFFLKPKLEAESTETGEAKIEKISTVNLRGASSFSNLKDESAENSVNRDRNFKAVQSEENESELESANYSSLFPEIKLLTNEERIQYKIVTNQIVRFYDWGRMETTQVDQFRQMVWEFGDRGIATLADELNNFGDEGSSRTKTQVSSQKNQDAISSIDTLRYFAEANNENAKIAIEHLASRKVEIDSEGKVTHSVHAGITLESMQLLAKFSPEKAAKIVQSQPASLKKLYIFNYGIGRQLAGLSSDKIQTEVDNSIL
jgi:hypothetical protein